MVSYKFLMFRCITCKNDGIPFIMITGHLQFCGRNSKISSSDSKLFGHFKYLPRSGIKMFKLCFVLAICLKLYKTNVQVTLPNGPATATGIGAQLYIVSLSVLTANVDPKYMSYNLLKTKDKLFFFLHFNIILQELTSGLHLVPLRYEVCSLYTLSHLYDF